MPSVDSDRNIRAGISSGWIPGKVVGLGLVVVAVARLWRGLALLRAKRHGPTAGGLTRDFQNDHFQKKRNTGAVFSIGTYCCSLPDFYIFLKISNYYALFLH